MSPLISSCNLYKYTEYLDIKRRRRCRNYFEFDIQVIFLYSKDMKYLKDIVFYNDKDHRAVNRYKQIMHLIHSKGGRIIFFNTNMQGNIELGDLVRRKPQLGHSMIVLKTSVLTLVERKGSFYLIQHHTHRKAVDFKIVKRFECRPEVIEMADFAPACPREVCKSDNMSIYPCNLLHCPCRGRGSRAKCYDCGKNSHLCYMGCGKCYLNIKSHMQTHYATCDEIVNLYWGQQQVENARDHLFIDIKRYPCQHIN